MNTKELSKKIRRQVLEMTHEAKSSHIGSMFSVADIVAVLYGDVLKYDAEDPRMKSRDRFILSKGHAGAVIFAVLAELGFFAKEKLDTYCQNGSDFCGHVSHKNIPGVEFSTGSLGHGISIGAGMALSARLSGRDNSVYVVMGDGECNEGSVWELALFGAHHKLDNLVAIVDYNNLQGLGTSESILSLEPFGEKWRSFGWNVYEVDGHDHDVLKKTFMDIKDSGGGKPHCVIARTIKGKGVSFMEDDLLWHYRTAQGEEYDAAVKELEASDQ